MNRLALIAAAVGLAACAVSERHPSTAGDASQIIDAELKPEDNPAAQGGIIEHAIKSTIVSARAWGSDVGELAVHGLDSSLPDDALTGIIAVVPPRPDLLLALLGSPSRIVSVVADQQGRWRRSGSPLVQGSIHGQLRYRSGRLYAAERDGIGVFDTLGNRLAKIPVFLAMNDFAIGTGDRVLVSTSSLSAPAPTAVLIDMQGSRIAVFRHVGNLAGVGDELARLEASSLVASCGNGFVVASEFRPDLTILTASLEVVARVTIPFPDQDRLLSLQRRSDLTTPRPGVFWLPRFVSGVHCDNQSVFVLLALPVPEIWQLDRRGNFRGSYRSTSGSYRRLEGLVDDKRGGWFTIGWTADRKTELLRLWRR